jgi:cation transport ATPase
MVTERLIVSIVGMTCASCVSRIERALRDREGVVWANVNFAAREATVTYDPSVIAPRQLAELVQHLGYETSQVGGRQRTGPEGASQSLAWAGPVLAGLVAGLSLVGLYLGLVTIAQDWKHALELLWGDRWLVAAIAAGFGVQIGLYLHLRRLEVLHHRLGHCKALTATGTGGSSVAMVACCAHHLTDVLPIIGFSAAATFLNQYRVPFLFVGIGTNLAGVAMMLWLIRQQRLLVSSQSGGMPWNNPHLV